MRLKSRASHRAARSAPALGSRQVRATRRLLPPPARRRPTAELAGYPAPPTPGSSRCSARADVLLAGANTVQAEGYGGYRPSGQQRAWRRARGLTEVPPITVVTRRCALSPAGPLFTGNPNPPAGDHLRSAPARAARRASRAR